MEQETSEIVLFFGRFHPLIIHLPIGFLIIAFVLEVMSRFERFRNYKPALGLVLFLGAASAVMAAILGLMLSQEGGYNEDLLDTHKWAGISLGIFAVGSFFLNRLRERKSSVHFDKAFLIVLFLMMITLTVTGHFGGTLTHGSDYLTQYMPDPLRKVAGLDPKKDRGIKKITNLNEAKVFADIIYPILDSRCISCHNNSKRKGDLMMHTVETLMKGGENGPVFIAGNVEESEMIKRIQLHENDEDHMPPKGKSQLSDEQIYLLTWWVREGAPFNKTVAELSVDEKAQNVLNTLVDPNANKTEVEKLLLSEIPPVDILLLDQLQKQGIKVIPLASQTNWLQANISPVSPLDSLLNRLLIVSENLTWLDLRGTTTRDQDLTIVAKFRYLTRLHLENTEISGEGLKHLGNLEYLEYLNLYGTEVNDDDIQQLAALKNLKKLYLWKTQTTEAGALQLQKELPGLEINLGWEIADTRR